MIAIATVASRIYAAAERGDIRLSRAVARISVASDRWPRALEKTSTVSSSS